MKAQGYSVHFCVQYLIPIDQQNIAYCHYVQSAPLLVYRHFSFESLRPGLWTVRVYDTGIPKEYELVTNLFNLSLIPGKSEHLEVKIKEKAGESSFKNYNHTDIKNIRQTIIQIILGLVLIFLNHVSNAQNSI